MKITCPVCGSFELTVCLDRARVPIFQNALYPDPERAKAAVVGDLAIRLCDGCGFVFNAAFEPDLVAYGADYENDQTVSATFAAHVDAMADQVMSGLEATAPTILEVGCGQGYFLTRLIARSDRALATAIGFDPAWRGGVLPDGIRIEASLFDAAAAAAIDSPIDAIVSRHVIEHVEDPVEFLASIRAALQPGTSPRLFIETPCVGWILDKQVLQDFFYEHCSYFTTETLSAILVRGGWRPLVVGHVFDGQYLWAEAEPDWETEEMPGAAPELDTTVRNFAEAAGRMVADWRSQLQSGPRAAVWGAAAKGVTFTTTIDPDGGLIDCLIDVNPRKQGNYTPVTAHPIVSAQEAAQRGVKRAIIMNPNYRAEIVAQVSRDDLGFELIDG